MYAQKPITYLASKAILEYMDPNTRFALASQYPSLRVAHRNTPLAIEKLTIRNGSFTLNGTTYSFRKIAEKNGKKKYRLMTSNVRTVSADPSYHDATSKNLIQKALRNVLSSRIPRHVKHLVLNASADVSFPEVPKLAVDKLEVKKDRSFLSGRVISLKNLCLQVDSLEDPVLRSKAVHASKRLTIKYNDSQASTLLSDREHWTGFVKGIQNKWAQISTNGHHVALIEELAGSLIESQMRIGTRRSVSIGLPILWSMILNHLKESMGAEWKLLPGKQLEQFPYCLSMAINASIELNLYMVKGPKSNVLMMEVMKTGTAKMP